MEGAIANTADDSAVETQLCSISGILPTRLNTVMASVLAYLLESNTSTGMDSVFKQSTTRLSDVIYRLERDYGWHADRNDIATGTNDGRIAYITTYWLSQSTIAQAFEGGARKWIDDVKAARAERRKQSEKCKTDATRLNVVRRKSKVPDPRQGSLLREDEYLTQYEGRKRADRTTAGSTASLTSFQRGVIDPVLAGLIAFGTVCAALLVGAGYGC